MEKKQKYILIAIAFALVVLCSGLTYAYFTSATPSESGSTIVAKGGTMNIKYDNGSGNIIVENIYPREAEWVNKTFTITGNNTTDLSMDYTVYLITKNNTFDSEALTYSISGTSTVLGDTLISQTNEVIPNSGSITLGTGIFKSKTATHTYSLKIYYKETGENQNNGQDKSYAGYVNLEPAAPDNWNEASSDSLIAGLKKNYAVPSATLTSPVSSSSITNESVMASTPDDYGNSYYFRGNVQNNYVSFAGMCWRIVRITGNGAIKLTLYNYSSADCTQTGENLAFARYSGTTYTTSFNDSYNDNAYIGFMYGTSNSSTYAATHANINKSTILKSLETWYTAKLSTYSDKLADVIWCNDKSTIKNAVKTVYNSISQTENNETFPGLGYGTSLTAYGSRVRNVGLYEIVMGDAHDGTGPSLICPNDNNGGKLSKFTVDDTTNGNGNLTYPIGLITSDEAAFAGINFNKTMTDKTSYLIANSTGSSYWTLSPFDYYSSTSSYSGGAHSWTISISAKHQYIDSLRPNQSSALRPAIALKSTTTISGGTGTASDPFIVN